jgi:hypothetical protein
MIGGNPHKILNLKIDTMDMMICICLFLQTGPSVQSGPSQSRSSSISSGSSQAPTQQPPTPPQLRGSQHGSIGRASGQQIAGNYRFKQIITCLTFAHKCISD